MGDLIFILAMLIFWGASYWFIGACERMRR